MLNDIHQDDVAEHSKKIYKTNYFANKFNPVCARLLPSSIDSYAIAADSIYCPIIGPQCFSFCTFWLRTDLIWCSTVVLFLTRHQPGSTKFPTLVKKELSAPLRNLGTDNKKGGCCLVIFNSRQTSDSNLGWPSLRCVQIVKDLFNLPRALIGFQSWSQISINDI